MTHVHDVRLSLSPSIPSSQKRRISISVLFLTPHPPLLMRQLVSRKKPENDETILLQHLHSTSPDDNNIPHFLVVDYHHWKREIHVNLSRITIISNTCRYDEEEVRGPQTQITLSPGDQLTSSSSNHPLIIT